MAAAKKELVDFVRSRSFLARRHAPLLDSSPPLRDPVLRLVQQDYQAASDPEQRRAIALRFEHLLRDEGEPLELMRRLHSLGESLIDVSVRSDLPDALIAEGTGAMLQITYRNPRKGVWKLILTDQEADQLAAQGWEADTTAPPRSDAPPQP